MDAAAWNARYATGEPVWSSTPNQFVAAECADLSPGHAVDLAAGEGRNAIWLAGRGWSVTAVDFADAGLATGRRWAADACVADRIDWVCADATTWAGDRPADLAVVAYLQLPADQRRAAVRAAVSGLRPGGTFLLVAHDSSNLTEGTGGPQDPSVLMTADDVVADLDGLDVDVQRAERVARLVAASEGHRDEPGLTAWDCLVRAVRRQAD